MFYRIRISSRHGDSWAAFRTKVSRVALSAGAAAQYTVPVAEVADAFINRYLFFFLIFVYDDVLSL